LKGKRTLLIIVVLIFIIIIFPPGTLFMPNCVLDGKFNDWQGKAYLSDTSGDAEDSHDISRLYYATNENDEKLYFMLQRTHFLQEKTSMHWRLYFDINCNGSYDDRADKYADLYFLPDDNESGEVEVCLYTSRGKHKGTYSGVWGEGMKNGAVSFEFAIPMKDLGVYPAQSLRFYLQGLGELPELVPDKGDNQWAPFPVRVNSRELIVIACILWLLILLFFLHSKIWVFYYIWGAVGSCCLLVLLLHGSFVEYRIEHYTGVFLHYLLDYVGITTYIFDKAPGTLLVLTKLDNSWTTINIDIENSAILEMCIFFGLSIFYPVLKIAKRIWFTIGGLILIYIINMIRLLTVIFCIHSGGRSMSFIAHTLVGRLVFFILIVAIYWRFITLPSLQKAREDIYHG